MLVLVCAAALAQTKLTLPAIFSDDMVLQREKPIPFFGHATPGRQIRVDLHGKYVVTTAKPDGSWMVQFRPMEAGGPYSVTVTADTTIRFQNVMIGEVWLAAGQSNMEFRADQANDYDQARSEADLSIRMFTVGRKSAESCRPDVEGSWVQSTSDTVGSFSAVANSFAHEIHSALSVPVGVIQSSWGGTPIESWTPRRAMLQDHDLAGIVQRYLYRLTDFSDREAKYEQDLASWTARVYKQDPGNQGMMDGWADYGIDTRDWRKVTLPNLLQVTEGQRMNGAVWYRKVVEIPQDWMGKALRLQLGPIADYDDTYVNGYKVGHTDAENEFAYARSRNYRIAPGLVREGKNEIAVRVFNRFGPGGFTGAPDQMKWGPDDGSSPPVSLAGEWVSRIEVKMDAASPDELNSKPDRPIGPGHPWAPGGLYNGMIAPIEPFGIRGVIWYQGEQNVSRAAQYRELFPLLITSWRKAWNDDQLPFYFVQLPGYTERLDHPAESDWAELREAQFLATSLPATAMAVTIDLGDANDIHPKNKREVGRRLALLALSHLFGGAVESSGPELQTMTIERDNVRLRFSHSEGMRASDGGVLRGFVVAGADHEFQWATAKIDGSSIVVSCAAVPNPIAVRYGWANNPDCNLVNSAGLPAAPFRTDLWPGITEGKD